MLVKFEQNRMINFWQNVDAFLEDISVAKTIV